METNRESKRVFRKIPSLKFLYEISADGRIFRNIKSKKVYRQFLNKNGYYYVNCTINKKRIMCTVHSLVAECYLGEKPKGYCIDHIDRNKHNNYHGNLRYVTYSENLHNTDKYENITNALKEYRDAANQRAKEVLGKKVLWGNLEFASKKEAAQYIAEQQGKNSNTVRGYFVKHKKYICGKPVKYL